MVLDHLAMHARITIPWLSGSPRQAWLLDMIAAYSSGIQAARYYNNGQILQLLQNDNITNGQILQLLQTNNKQHGQILHLLQAIDKE